MCRLEIWWFFSEKEPSLSLTCMKDKFENKKTINKHLGKKIEYYI